MDGTGGQVKILLLDVARLALKGHVALPAVDEHLAGNDAHRGAIGEAIEERGFAGARHTHKGSEGAGFDLSIDMIQNPASLFLDFHFVAHIAPLKDGGLPLDDGSGVRVRGAARSSVGSTSLGVASHFGGSE